MDPVVVYRQRCIQKGQQSLELEARADLDVQQMNNHKYRMD
jgi:hypothetical protein